MIDTKTFQPGTSRWEDIFDCLEENGFKVFPPGIATGECKAPYVVVKNDGSTSHSSFSTDVALYAVMCYVPKQAYSKLEPLVQNVKKTLKKLEPMISQYGNEAPSYYDDSVKAHMISIEYKNYKKQ